MRYCRFTGRVPLYSVGWFLLVGGLFQKLQVRRRHPDSAVQGWAFFAVAVSPLKMFERMSRFVARFRLLRCGRPLLGPRKSKSFAL